MENCRKAGAGRCEACQPPVRIHLKDFKRKGYQWTNLLEGDVNWPQVRKALAEISYKGYLTTELRAGDEAYLTDLAQRIDKIITLPTA